jgi:hypothetical protein
MPRNDRAVDSATQPCPNQHFFDLTVTFAPEPNRPDWWPKDQLSGYGSEQIRLTGAGIAPPDHALDSSGHLKIGDLPSGSAQVELPQLLASVRKALEEGCVYDD